MAIVDQFGQDEHGKINDRRMQDPRGRGIAAPRAGARGGISAVSAFCGEPSSFPLPTSVPALGARIPIPVGVRPEIHARFWSVVERACEKACAELPAAILEPEVEADAAD
jgi:hypothetical protein